MDRSDAGGRRAELARAVTSDRVHGAYLFEGPAGTGRRDTAHWFARLVLCREPGDDPCDQCRDCLRSRPSDESPLGSHADLIWIEPDGTQVKIDQVRGLQRTLALTPNEGGRRVAVIVDAERMNAGSANALLKTLEEPPPRTTLVLVAEQADTLPPTIRSRTTRIRFAPERETDVALALRDEGLDEVDAVLAAALGGGSRKSARDWAEEYLERAREMWDALDAQDGDVTELLDLAESFRGQGAAARERTELMLAVHGVAARRRVERAVEGGDRKAAAHWLDRVEEGARVHREYLRRNLNPQLVVEGLLLGWQR